jgi:hypothetical protein
LGLINFILAFNPAPNPALPPNWGKGLGWGHKVLVLIKRKANLKIFSPLSLVTFLCGRQKSKTFEGRAVPIPENQIEVLRRLVATEAEIEVTADRFHEGDKVEVRTGPLFGLSGELVEFRGKRLVLMRIDQIGQSLLVNIPLAFLEPAK